MEYIQQQTLKLSKLDLTILITSSFIYAYSYFTLTLWFGIFEHILVYTLAPLVMGCLGLTYILLQNSDLLGMILLSLSFFFDLIFGTWWFVLQFDQSLVDDKVEDVFYFILNLLVSGIFYLSPGIICGIRAFQIFKKTDVQKNDKDFLSVLSLFAASVLLVFNYNVFYISNLQTQFLGSSEYLATGICAIAGFFSVIVGIVSIIKNLKIPLFIYIGIQSVFWLIFIILFVIVGGYKAGNGIWVFTNSCILLTFNYFQAQQLQKGITSDLKKTLI